MTYAIAELMRLGLTHAEAVQFAAFLARKGGSNSTQRRPDR